MKWVLFSADSSPLLGQGSFIRPLSDTFLAILCYLLSHHKNKCEAAALSLFSHVQSSFTLRKPHFIPCNVYCHISNTDKPIMHKWQKRTNHMRASVIVTLENTEWLSSPELDRSSETANRYLLCQGYCCAADRGPKISSGPLTTSVHDTDLFLLVLVY